MPFAAAAFEWVNAALSAALIGTIEPSVGGANRNQGIEIPASRLSNQRDIGGQAQLKLHP
jgi:hypothetical protein